MFHLRKVMGPIPPTVANRNAEPDSDPEPPEPVAFDRTRSRRNVLLGTGAWGVKNWCLWLRKKRPDHPLKKYPIDFLDRSRTRFRTRPKFSRLRVPGGEAWLNEPHLHIRDARNNNLNLSFFILITKLNSIISPQSRSQISTQIHRNHR